MELGESFVVLLLLLFICCCCCCVYMMCGFLFLFFIPIGKQGIARENLKSRWWVFNSLHVVFGMYVVSYIHCINPQRFCYNYFLYYQARACVAVLKKHKEKSRKKSSISVRILTWVYMYNTVRQATQVLKYLTRSTCKILDNFAKVIVWF